MARRAAARVEAGTGDTLLWSGITAFGDDAVTVPGAEAIAESNPAIAALSGRDHRRLAKRVPSSVGADLGEVVDVEFDPQTGGISALVLASGDVAGQRLIGIGSYAVIVHDPPSSELPSRMLGGLRYRPPEHEDEPREDSLHQLEPARLPGDGLAGSRRTHQLDQLRVRRLSIVADMDRWHAHDLIGG